jgi:hypothetical protein
MVDRDLSRELELAAIARFESDADAGAGLRSGVRMLDCWRDARYGAVLFWVDRELDLRGFGHAVLHNAHFELANGVWRTRGGGGGGTFTASEILAEKGVGLHRLGGSSCDPMRLTLAIASPEVSSVELRNDHGISSRAPGVDGFCLLGITHSDPITYARPLDADGRPLASEPLLL